MMEKENVIPNISITSESPRKYLDSPRKQKIINGNKGSPVHKSPSRAPVSTKILFFEQNDANTAHTSDSKTSSYFPEIKEKIQFYECIFMGSKSSGKRDVVIKHDDWKRMISDLLSQVQARESQLRESEGRADRSDKSLESSKAAYDALNDALQEAPTLMKHTRAEIGRLNTLVSSTAQPQADSTQTRIRMQELAANQELREDNQSLREENQSLKDEKKILESQAAQDRHYSQCAEEKVEQLMVELMGEQEKAKHEQEKAQAEIANLTQKLISRNAELKLYKAKVENFLENLETRTVTPTKKRMSICSDASSSSSSSYSSSSTCPGSASKRPRPSPAFTSPSPRFDYRFDPTRYEK